MIVPGAAVFHWIHQCKWPRDLYEGELPAACNWIGAILIKLGYTRSTPLPWSDADKYLEVGTYWMYRFHMGFDRGRQLTRNIKGKGKKPYLVEETTSKEGLKMGRRYWSKA